MSDFFGSAAFFEEANGGSSDSSTPAPNRPPSGSVYKVRNAETLDPLADGTTMGDGYWRYHTDDPNVRAIQVSGDGAEWSEVFFDQNFLLTRVTAPVIVGSADTTPATGLPDGTAGWSMQSGKRVLMVVTSGAWVPYYEGVTQNTMQDADAVILAQAKAYTEQRIQAVLTGTTGGGTNPDGSPNTDNTQTLTYTTAYSTSFNDANGWNTSSPGSTISNGQLLVGGNYKEGAIWYKIDNVVPGRKVKATYTINTASTGSMIPILDAINSSWTWIDTLEPDPANGDTEYTKSFVGSFIIPTGATSILIGARNAYGTTVIDDLKVEISDTIAPLTPPPPAIGSSVLALPINYTNVIEKDCSSWPVDPNSSLYVKHLTDEIATLMNGQGVVAFNLNQYTTSLWIVDNTTPKTDWFYNNTQNWSWTPSGMFDGIQYNKQVPTPPNLVASSGTDHAVSIYNKDTGQLWEFWIAEKNSAGQWGCQQGWRTDNIRESMGAYQHIGEGVSASGIMHPNTSIHVDELRAGAIPHALSLNIMWNRKSGQNDSYVTPATRNTDGADTYAYALPYGARLRIKGNAVMPTNLHPIAQQIWTAAKKYGILVQEKSGWTAIGADPDDQRRLNTGIDYWAPLLNGTPDYLIMQNFPWSDLELVQLGYKG